MDVPGGGGVGESGVDVPAAGGGSVGDGVQSAVGEQAEGVGGVACGRAWAVAVFGVEVEGEHGQSAGGIPEHDGGRGAGQDGGEGSLGGGGVGASGAADHA